MSDMAKRLATAGRFLRQNLGRRQVYKDGAFLSFSQQGDFHSARLDPETGDVLARGPSSLYPSARLRPLSLLEAPMLDGIQANLILVVMDQSTAAGTTGDNGGTNDPTGTITTRTPISNLYMFNGGINPHQLGPNKGLGAHTTAIDSAQIASLVPALSNVNANDQGREKPAMVLGETIAAMVPGHMVTILSLEVGSCDHSEIWGNSIGSPAMPAQNVATCLAAAVALTPAGYTPLLWIVGKAGFEAESTLVAIANWQNQQAITRGIVDGWMSITGQTLTPLIAQQQIGTPRADGIHEATGVDSTGASIYGTAPMYALGPLYQVVNGVDANMVVAPRYLGRGGGTAGTTASVHFASAAYSECWQGMGILCARHALGLSTLPLYIVPGSVVRVANSATVNFTLSRAAEIDETMGLASTGAGKGFTYYSGGSKKTVTGCTIVGTAGSITLSAVPAASIDEFLGFAYDNATEYTAPVHGVSVGAYGVGSQNGLRGAVRATVINHYLQRDGRPFIEPLAHSKETADVYASVPGLVAAHTETAIARLKLALDFRDTNCIASSTAQALTNLGTSGATNDFYRGASSGSSTDDPTIFGWVSAPGALNRSMGLRFDGGDICTPQGTLDILADAHKSGGKWSMLVMGKVVTSANAQVIAATCEASGGTAAQGVFMQLASNGKIQAGVKGAGNAAVITINSTSSYTTGEYFVAMCSFEDTVLAWLWTDKDGFVSLTGNARNYSSPSSSAAQSALAIGRGGLTGPTSTRLQSGFEIHALEAGDVSFSTTAWLPILRTLKRSQIDNAY